jgi:hypothetical protein
MVVKKGGFFQKVGGMLESAATRVDNAVFKTEAANMARKNMDNPDFAEFLTRTAERVDLDVEKFRAGGDDRKLGAAYERFERVSSTVAHAKEVLITQFKEQMGVDITETELQSVEAYLKDESFDNPKTFERLSTTFEKGIKLQAEVAERRGKLEALKDRFGRDTLALMDMRAQGGMFGNKETRAWAREEARERGYGPIRSWMFKAFSANSAIEDKISETSKLSPEKRKEAYAHIMGAQSGVEKIEGTMHNTIVARMLEQSDFAVKAIGIAREKALQRVALAIERPEDLDVRDLVEERKRLATLAESNFAPEDGVFEEAGVGGAPGQTVEYLTAALEYAVQYRVDQKMEELVTLLADQNANPGFSELLTQVQGVVEELSDGTPDGNQEARIQVAERLAQRQTANLTASKGMLVSMVINHLSR